MVNSKDVAAVVHALLVAQCYQATKYISSREVIRCTIPRRRRGKAWDKRDNRRSFVLSIGAPNYLERRFIAACRKAGEPIPVKKVQLRDFPQKR